MTTAMDSQQFTRPDYPPVDAASVLSETTHTTTAAASITSSLINLTTSGATLRHELPPSMTANLEAPANASIQIVRGEARTPIPLLTRLFEIGVASFILLATSPLMLIVALILWFDTPGPLLFFQRRVGAGLRPFRFVKFRTLYADAKERFPELYAYRYTPTQLAELKFKVEDDPRVTPQGRWLRKTSLDELPNFWNVLMGEMALVGPRPEIPEMLPYYTGEMLHKFRVRPGVTGLAQISGRGRLGFYETVALDVKYVHHQSFFYDLKILLTTMWMILKRDGAF